MWSELISNGEVVSAHVTKRITDNKCEYNDEKYKMDDITVGCGEYWAYGEEGDLSENDLALCDHCNPLKKIPVQDCEAWYEYDTEPLTNNIDCFHQEYIILSTSETIQ